MCELANVTLQHYEQHFLLRHKTVPGKIHKPRVFLKTRKSLMHEEIQNFKKAFMYRKFIGLTIISRNYFIFCIEIISLISLNRRAQPFLFLLTDVFVHIRILFFYFFYSDGILSIQVGKKSFIKPISI